MSLNRFEINAIQKNWFDIKETGKKEDGYPVYRLTGNKEKLLQWLRANYDRSFSSSNIHDSIHDSKFYVGLSKYDYTKEQAEKDARKFGLQLKIVGKSSDPNVEYDAYLIGPRSNILKMLKANDMEDFEEDIEN